MAHEVEKITEESCIGESEKQTCFICTSEIVKKNAQTFLNSWARFVDLPELPNSSQVEICKNCQPVCSPFLELYHQWKLLELRLEWQLKTILGRLKLSDGTAKPKFRQLLLEKSALKLSQSTPRLFITPVKIVSQISTETCNADVTEMESEAPASPLDSQSQFDNDDESIQQNMAVKCLECGKKYRDNTLLQMHTLRVHRKRSHLCKDCGKAFSFNYLLQQHKKCHQSNPIKKKAIKLTGKFKLDSKEVKVQTSQIIRGPIKAEPEIPAEVDAETVSLDDLDEMGWSPDPEPSPPNASESQFDNHDESIQQNKAVKCLECGRKYGKRTLLRMHTIRVHRKRSHLCKECGKAFPFNYQLQQHKKCHEGNPVKKKGRKSNRGLRIYSKEVKVPTFQIISGPIKVEPEILAEADTETVSQGDVDEIAWTPGPAPSPPEFSAISAVTLPGGDNDILVKRGSCTTAESQDNSRSENGNEEIGNVKCPQCEKCCRNETLLKMHTIRVHRERSHRCQKCEKAFAFPYSLQLHIQKCDPTIATTIKRKVSPKSRKCSYCDLEFKLRGTLRAHIRRKHRDKTHICDECGKSFGIKYEMTRHKIHSHQTVPPNEMIPCPKCGKECKDKQALSAHESTVHRERTNVCEECGKSFNFRSRLEMHKQRCHQANPKPKGPKIWKCPECGNMFREKYNLNNHIRMVHTGHNFLCGECGKTYKTRPDLNKHVLRVHLGKDHWKFECTKCQIKFASTGDLKNHRIRLHGEDK